MFNAFFNLQYNYVCYIMLLKSPLTILVNFTIDHPRRPLQIMDGEICGIWICHRGKKCIQSILLVLQIHDPQLFIIIFQTLSNFVICLHVANKYIVATSIDIIMPIQKGHVCNIFYGNFIQESPSIPLLYINIMENAYSSKILKKISNNE